MSYRHDFPTCSKPIKKQRGAEVLSLTRPTGAWLPAVPLAVQSLSCDGVLLPTCLKSASACSLPPKSLGLNTNHRKQFPRVKAAWRGQEGALRVQQPAETQLRDVLVSHVCSRTQTPTTEDHQQKKKKKRCSSKSR